jgi:hypothetical protein
VLLNFLSSCDPLKLLILCTDEMRHEKYLTLTATHPKFDNFLRSKPFKDDASAIHVTL